MARGTSKGSRETERSDRLSLYLYPFHIHSFKLTLEDTPANSFHSIFSHLPFNLFFLYFCEMISPLFYYLLKFASSINYFDEEHNFWTKIAWIWVFALGLPFETEIWDKYRTSFCITFLIFNVGIMVVYFRIV